MPDHPTVQQLKEAEPASDVSYVSQPNWWTKGRNSNSTQISYTKRNTPKDGHKLTNECQNFSSVYPGSLEDTPTYSHNNLMASTNVISFGVCSQ